MNKLVGYLNVKETMDISGEIFVDNWINSSVKENIRNIKYYKNKNVITCVIKSNGKKAVGLAKCNPKDKFNYRIGFALAEFRARENLYKITIENYIETLRWKNDICS